LSSHFLILSQSNTEASDCA